VLNKVRKKIFNFMGQGLTRLRKIRVAREHPEGQSVAPTFYQELALASPSPAALEAFPDWSGLLVKSSVLGFTVWVVRSRRDGEELAKETGHPALLLADVLNQKSKPSDEARVVLLSHLITGTKH
jgi:hypothetical protein